MYIRPETQKLLDEGSAKREDILATLRAVRGEPYADAVYAAVVAFNATNAVVKACNEGLVHQLPRMVLAAIIPNAQSAISELLMAHPAVSVVDPKDVVNDVNSLLGLITSTMRAIKGGSK